MSSSRNRSFLEAVSMSLTLVGFLYLVKAFEFLFFPLAQYGILPRTQVGLRGILWSPFLHANMAHLVANSIPLFVLLIFLFSNSKYHPWRTLFFIWIASGLGTWLIGRGGAVHIGASSIILGLVAFLITAGFCLRSWGSALVAIVVFFCYGGVFWGVLPQPGPVSWEGHLCGMIAGFFTARNLRR